MCAMGFRAFGHAGDPYADLFALCDAVARVCTELHGEWARSKLCAVDVGCVLWCRVACHPGCSIRNPSCVRV